MNLSGQLLLNGMKLRKNICDCTATVMRLNCKEIDSEKDRHGFLFILKFKFLVSLITNLKIWVLLFQLSIKRDFLFQIFKSDDVIDVYWKYDFVIGGNYFILYAVAQ